MTSLALPGMRLIWSFILLGNRSRAENKNPPLNRFSIYFFYMENKKLYIRISLFLGGAPELRITNIITWRLQIVDEIVHIK